MKLPLLLAVAAMLSTFVSAQGSFALLELYSSEGCSSCPAAEQVLSAIAKEAQAQQQRVLLLTFHVTYWDYLGWKDPFGQQAFTKRQNDYAQKMNLSSLYTPQVVINGTREAVGSNRNAVLNAVATTLKATHSAALMLSTTLDKDGNSVKLAWRGTDLPKGAIVCLALVENERSQYVPRGENASRTLVHHGLVRAYTESAATSDGLATLALPEGASAERLMAVGWVQASKGSMVVALAQADLAK